MQATIRGNSAAIATHHGGRFYVHTFRIEDAEASLFRSSECLGEVTSLVFCTLQDWDHLLVGSWKDGNPYVEVFDSREEMTESRLILQINAGECSSISSGFPCDST